MEDELPYGRVLHAPGVKRVLELGREASWRLLRRPLYSDAGHNSVLFCQIDLLD